LSHTVQQRSAGLLRGCGLVAFALLTWLPIE